MVWYSLNWPNAWLGLISSGIVLESPFSPTRGFQLNVILFFFVIHLLSRKWVSLVTKYVPEPYLDEVFHIPQAQAYCNGSYDVWDPKLTTPPGLYIFTTVFNKIWPGITCNTAGLRLFNNFTLALLMGYATDCRALITRTWKSPVSLYILNWNRLGKVSSSELHVAFNIAMFPPLFFFSGLFYTDVLSTVLVVRTYRLYLERSGGYDNSGSGLIWIYITGVLALTMRQTNIFWVAVFLGGLELVRTLGTNKILDTNDVPVATTWKEEAIKRYGAWSRGFIHNPRLRDAGILDFALCAVSIVVAALNRPFLIIRRLWPYILLLISFVGFVVWNGGVVLGDKSNHVATIHLPQMLYIWPFIAFFSAPLLIPAGINFLTNLFSLLRLPAFPRLVSQYKFVAAYITIALIATLTIIHFNTIIHPFTLADNRHYMFYIFRYSILRSPYIKYLLAPIYLLCAWLVYYTLIGPEKTPAQQALALKKFKTRDEISTAAITRWSTNGPTTSFVLILLLTTTLSLITAPLVEPRYFIIPWVIWRLNVPPLFWDMPNETLEDEKRRQEREEERKRPDPYDWRLWLETIWFVGINAVTGWVFLYKGFEWKQEPGNVQRFMW